MAFQSNGPVMLALPPFRGFTRRIVLFAVCAWLAETVLVIAAGRYSMRIIFYLALQPSIFPHLQWWQAVTYPFVGMGLLNILFVLLTVWFFGSRLEDDLGKRWLTEYFFWVTIGGAVIATVVCYLLGRWVPLLNPKAVFPAMGLWPVAMAIMLAFARFHSEEEIRLYFVLRVKAKYVAALFLAVYVAVALTQRDSFSALVALTNALCGWMFLKFVPIRGLRFAASEKWFAMRNSILRNKRKRAAKDFEVYMRKQGKDVRVDDSNDSNDKKWMN